MRRCAHSPGEVCLRYLWFFLKLSNFTNYLKIGYLADNLFTLSEIAVFLPSLNWVCLTNKTVDKQYFLAYLLLFSFQGTLTPHRRNASAFDGVLLTVSAWSSFNNHAALRALPLKSFALLIIRRSLCLLLLLFWRVVGLSGLEPPTSRLSGGRSNRLSYKPILVLAQFLSLWWR